MIFKGLSGGPHPLRRVERQSHIPLGLRLICPEHSLRQGHERRFCSCRIARDLPPLIWKEIQGILDLLPRPEKLGRLNSGAEAACPNRNRGERPTRKGRPWGSELRRIPIKLKSLRKENRRLGHHFLEGPKRMTAPGWTTLGPVVDQTS